MNQGHVKSGEVINLETLRANMDVDASYAIVKTSNIEVIRMALPEGKEVREHQLDSALTIQCLRGQTKFQLGDINRTLKAGDWMYLKPRHLYSYSVLTDTILLVTIIFQAESDEE